MRYVVDAMSKNPVMIGADRPAWAALAEAKRRGVHHVLVCRRNEVLGFASTADLRKASTDTEVQHLVADPPVYVSDQASLQEAERLMREHDTDCLPVTRWEGKLCGVITRGDIARAREEEPGASAPQTCASCGTGSNLTTPVGPDVVFCEQCAKQSNRPKSPNDEIYFTTGGGD